MTCGTRPATRSGTLKSKKNFNKTTLSGLSKIKNDLKKFGF